MLIAWKGNTPFHGTRANLSFSLAQSEALRADFEELGTKVKHEKTEFTHTTTSPSPAR